MRTEGPIYVLRSPRLLIHLGGDPMAESITNCQNVAERLSDYIEEELGASDRAALDDHLAGCAICRQTLADLRRTISLLGHLPRHKRPS